MKGKIISLFLGILIPVGVFAQNTFSLSGRVITPTSWFGGNIGNSWFGTGVSTAYFDAQGKLGGTFWVGSSGWATFQHGDATINCDANILDESPKDKTKNCPLTGRVWMYSAGWIDLKKGNQQVIFNPNSGNLEGFGWSSSLGWVPFFTGKIFDTNQRVNPDLSGFLDNNWYGTDAQNNTSINLNFIGKVAVIGHIAGTKIFEVENGWNYKNQDFNELHNLYGTIQHAPLMNQVRKNVAHITRNINKTNSLNQPINGILYNEQKDYCLVNSNHENDYSEYCRESTGSNRITLNQVGMPSFENVKTIIIKGHDVIIDGDFNATNDNNSSLPEAKNMKAIIALKDRDGNGGNIIITKNTNKIFAYLVAENAIISGEKTGTRTEFYIDKGKVGNSGLPTNQLYINGIAISKNTIGGNTRSTDEKCPILNVNCGNEAKKYDFSYFRNFIYKDESSINIPSFRSSVDDKVKHATMIIDYNNAILSEPPPGLENVR